MVAPALSLVATGRIPSLEPVVAAVIDVIEALWSDAAAVITSHSPSDGAVLDGPAQYRLTTITSATAYELPTQWPAVVIGGSNLRRSSGQTNLVAGDWRGLLEFHAWLQDDNPDRLVRSLERYAATLWLVLLSADAGHALAGASLLPETFTIGQQIVIGQSIAQQAIALAVEVTLRA